MEEKIFPVHVPIDVRWRDFDANGCVSSTSFFTYLEVARTVYYEKVLDAAALDRIDFMVVNAVCDHLVPLTARQVIDVGVRVSRVGRTSFDFEYLVTARGGEVKVARARTTQVLFDYSTKSKKPVTGEWLEPILKAQGGKL